MSSERCGIWLNGKVQCRLPAFHRHVGNVPRTECEYDPEEAKQAFPKWSEEHIKAFTNAPDKVEPAVSSEQAESCPFKVGDTVRVLSVEPNSPARSLLNHVVSVVEVQRYFPFAVCVESYSGTRGEFHPDRLVIVPRTPVRRCDECHTPVLGENENVCPLHPLAPTYLDGSACVSSEQSPALLPCPFCGSTKILNASCLYPFYLYCANCLAKGPHEGSETIGEKWNSRKS